MFEIISTFSLTAAGGMGFLAVKHYNQYKELSTLLIWVFMISLLCGMLISMTIDITAMEFKYKLDSEKRAETMAVVDSWQSAWWKVILFSGGALVYTVLLLAISHSIEDERKAKLQNTNDGKSNLKVSESE